MGQNLENIYLPKIVQWAKSSSSHGIPNIVSTKNRAVRYMWLIFFLSSFAYCVYTIITSIDEYSQYKTTLSLKKVQEVPQIFPAVTLCNINSFSENDDSFIDFLTTAVKKPQCLEYFRNSKKCKETKSEKSDFCIENEKLLKPCFNATDFYIYQIKSFIANNITDDIIEKKDLGITFDDLVLSCEFNGGHCDENNFTRFWSNEYGNCFTFNSNGNEQTLQKAVQKGYKTGLKLQIRLSKLTNVLLLLLSVYFYEFL